MSEYIFTPNFTPPDRSPDIIEGSPNHRTFRTFWQATPEEPSLEVIEFRPANPVSIPPISTFSSFELACVAKPGKPLANFYAYVGYQSSWENAPSANITEAPCYRMESRYPHARYAEERLTVLRDQQFIPRFKPVDGKFSARTFCEAASGEEPAFLWAENGGLAEHDGLDHAIAGMLLTEEIVGRYGERCAQTLKQGRDAVGETAESYERHITRDTAILVSDALSAEERSHHLLDRHIYTSPSFCYWEYVARAIGGLLGSQNTLENLRLTTGLRQQAYWLINNVPRPT